MMGARYCFWGSRGSRGYIAGVLIERHTFGCRPGFWRVSLAGWGGCHTAVVDDFGTLVQVY